MKKLIASVLFLALFLVITVFSTVRTQTGEGKYLTIGWPQATSTNIACGARADAPALGFNKKHPFIEQRVSENGCEIERNYLAIILNKVAMPLALLFLAIGVTTAVSLARDKKHGQ